MENIELIHAFVDADESQPSDTQPRTSLAKSFGVSSRAAEFQALRAEILQSLAKARAERDSDSLRELCQMRLHLDQQAQVAGLRLDHTMRFVPF